MIAAFVLLALAAGTLAAVKSTTASRMNQQAGNLLAQQIEELRALDYASLANRGSEVVGQPGVTGTATAATYTPPNKTAESMVLDAAGAVSPHKASVLQNATQFTVRRYVTKPVDASGDYKRLTIVVTWTSTDGTVKTRSSSTLLTLTERGLPLPRFRIQGSPVTRTVTPGDEADFGLRIDNLGARDAFELSVGSGTWTYYVDTDKDGLHDATETTLAPDADADGVADTGYLEPNTSTWLVAARPTLTTETGTVTYVWTAKSVAQPDAETASESTATLTLVLSGTVPAASASPSTTSGATNEPATVPAAACNNNGVKCIVDIWYLKQPTAGPTSSQTPLVLQQTVHNPQSLLNDYSTERGEALGGRHLALGAVADFRYAIPYDAGTKSQAPAPTVRFPGGKAKATVHVRCLAAGARVGVLLQLGHATSSTGTVINVGSGTTVVTNCPSAGFHTLDVGLSTTSVPTTATHLSLRVSLDSLSTSAVRLAYDTAANAAFIQIPRSN